MLVDVERAFGCIVVIRTGTLASGNAYPDVVGCDSNLAASGMEKTDGTTMTARDCTFSDCFVAANCGWPFCTFRYPASSDATS